MANKSDAIIKDLKALLLQDENGTQETLCAALEARGHRMNQSKVSRLLRKVGAIKSKNAEGEMVYGLPHDAEAPPVSSVLSELVLDVVANESMIVIRTSPGAASLLARVIDHKKCDVLGTIAGDDTVFVVPVSVKTIEQSMACVRACLACL